LEAYFAHWITNEQQWEHFLLLILLIPPDISHFSNNTSKKPTRFGAKKASQK